MQKSQHCSSYISHDANKKNLFNSQEIYQTFNPRSG